MQNILVIGLGMFGMRLARNMKMEGCDVMGVDKDEVRANHATEFLRNIQIADATDEHFIRSLGVEHFDMCVVAIDDDFPSALEITVLLKDYKAPFILCRADTESHKKLLLRNGADKVVCSDIDTAERLAFTYAYDNVFDYISLNADTGIYEIETPHSWVGHTFDSAHIAKKYDLNIIAIKNGDTLTPLPSKEHVFSKEEHLVVMCTEKTIRVLL